MSLTVKIVEYCEDVAENVSDQLQNEYIIQAI